VTDLCQSCKFNPEKKIKKKNTYPLGKFITKRNWFQSTVKVTLPVFLIFWYL